MSSEAEEVEMAEQEWALLFRRVSDLEAALARRPRYVRLTPVALETDEPLEPIYVAAGDIRQVWPPRKWQTRTRVWLAGDESMRSVVESPEAILRAIGAEVMTP